MLTVGCCAATAAVWQYPVKADLVRVSDAAACCPRELAETSKSGNELPSRGQEALIFGVKHPGILERRVHCVRQAHNFHGGKCDFKYLRIFGKSVEKIQISLKSDMNNRYFASRPVNICDNISLSSY